jgi:hypothetical protein
MLAAGCSERCPTAVADRGARPTIAMASGDTISTTVTIPVTIPGSSTATSTAAPTSSASATLGLRGACRQSNDCENEHEQSETCHVAPPP